MRSLAIGLASIGFYGPMTCLRREFKQWPGLQGVGVATLVARAEFNLSMSCSANDRAGTSRPIKRVGIFRGGGRRLRWESGRWFTPSTCLRSTT
jgi:hypothetical protein